MKILLLALISAFVLGNLLTEWRSVSSSLRGLPVLPLQTSAVRAGGKGRNRLSHGVAVCVADSLNLDGIPGLIDSAQSR